MGLRKYTKPSITCHPVETECNSIIGESKIDFGDGVDVNIVQEPNEDENFWNDWNI